MEFMNYSVIKTKNVMGKFKIESLKSIWNDEFVCLRSKADSFKCKDDFEIIIRLKELSKSQSKHNKFEDYKTCLDGEHYQKECDNYILGSINHKMYLQQVKKLTLSIFDDKRNYLNKEESLLWNQF